MNGLKKRFNPANNPTSEPGTTGNAGDVNNDGSVDIIDALLTAQYYVDLDPQNFGPSNLNQILYYFLIFNS